MKVAIVIGILLAAVAAGAETKIIEYPDHIDVEIVGGSEKVAGTQPARAAEETAKAPAGPAAKTASAKAATAARKDDEVSERISWMSAEIRRLEKERRVMLKPLAWDTPGDQDFRAQRAEETQEEIDRLRKELEELRARKAAGN